MTPITLKEAISEEIKDKEFAILYEKVRIINSIACTLDELRQQQELTQSKICQKAHTTQPVIARLKRGSNFRISSLEIIGRIAYAPGNEIVVDFKAGQHH